MKYPIVAFCGDTSLVCTDNKRTPFQNLLTIFEQCDYIVINLETTILHRNENYIRKKNKSVYFSVYEDELNWLISFKFKEKIVFSLANNHILDYGDKGLKSTINFLDENSIKYIPLSGYLRLIIDNYIVNMISSHDETNRLFSFSVREEVKKLNKQEINIIINHEGLEHVILPSNSQKKKYKQYIDLGFNIVVGHHSHTPQGIECGDNYVIAYSLGNFNFVQPDIRPTFINRFSYILIIEVNKGELIYSQIPYVIDEKGIPFIKKEKRYMNYLEEINKLLYIGNIFIEPIHSSYPYLKNNIVGGWIPRFKKNFLGEIINLFKWFFVPRFIISVILLPLYPSIRPTRLLRKINRNA